MLENSDRFISNLKAFVKGLGYTIISFGMFGSLTSKQKEEMDVDAGVWVSNVKRYSPAAERNLFQGGVITKADRKPVKSCSQFKSLIDSKNSGDVVLLQVKYKERNQIIALEIP